MDGEINMTTLLDRAKNVLGYFAEPIGLIPPGEDMFNISAAIVAAHLKQEELAKGMFEDFIKQEQLDGVAWEDIPEWQRDEYRFFVSSILNRMNSIGENDGN